MHQKVGEIGTQGQLSRRLQSVAQAAGVFRGSVPSPRDGSARSLAEGALALDGASWGLAVVVRSTPEGTVLDLGLAHPGQSEEQQMGFGGHPELVTRWATTSALNLLRLALLR